jgi:hypothetical protein
LPELRDSIWGYFCLKALGSHRGPFAMTMRRAKAWPGRQTQLVRDAGLALTYRVLLLLSAHPHTSSQLFTALSHSSGIRLAFIVGPAVHCFARVFVFAFVSP